MFVGSSQSGPRDEIEVIEIYQKLKDSWLVGCCCAEAQNLSPFIIVCSEMDKIGTKQKNANCTKFDNTCTSSNDKSTST